ncbi:hypothetical protein GQ457_06G025600 [Hibiscus cannabinus]
MEFWGAEVKSGQIFEVELEDDDNRVLHISQVALGEVTSDGKKEKGNGDVCIYLKFNNQKFVIGTLSQEKFPQMQLDLVLDGKFELSHTWKSGSIYFTGYYVDTIQGGDSEFEDEHLEPTVNPVKPHATTSDPTTSKQVKIVEPNKEEDSSDDEDEDVTSTEDEVSSDDQEPGLLVNGENESDDDSEEESSDEDQETPEAEKAGPSKKRSAESATRTPASGKRRSWSLPLRQMARKWADIPQPLTLRRKLEKHRLPLVRGNRVQIQAVHHSSASLVAGHLGLKMLYNLIQRQSMDLQCENKSVEQYLCLHIAISGME